MQTLRQLKMKYSGQEIPDWELVANGLKQGEAPPVRRGRSPKVEEPEPDAEGE